MYLIPDKFTDLNSCTLKVGAIILKNLYENNKNKMKYTELFEKLEKEYGDDTGYGLKSNKIIPKIILFLLNKINYKLKGDLVELIK